MQVGGNRSYQRPTILPARTQPLDLATETTIRHNVVALGYPESPERHNRVTINGL